MLTQKMFSEMLEHYLAFGNSPRSFLVAYSNISFLLFRELFFFFAVFVVVQVFALYIIPAAE